ncbi:hypothetical protein PN462_17545 [Spirulina sp. CS-785/01]|uniref:hypothetical protein n=1 Tax=Spirulina sp. CS-785/01 TaxID=3021716 RepID=UPI002330EB52|nr:hypothetical protein [Spirulina sp. CS-785/01]MDB9314922.1 hypothetical protein [Spirulina sp. CS-785/01]
MAGLFGLFGRKKQENETTDKKGAYFLDADQAKTFGDIDYMRKPLTIKHTFPQNVSNGGSFEVVNEISAMEKNTAGQTSPSQQVAETASFNISSNGSQPTTPTPSRRPSGYSNDMDMFRNMAKNMRR